MRPDLITRARARLRRAFTLVEVLIVVVILGVLAGIVSASFTTVTDDAARGAFVSELRIIADQAMYYMVKNNAVVGDSGSGDCPPELRDVIDEQNFEAGTPIGGVWDFEHDDTGGYWSAVGVHFNGSGTTRDDAFMTIVDEIFDDGDLTDGAFREIEDDQRYYYIIIE